MIIVIINIIVAAYALEEVVAHDVALGRLVRNEIGTNTCLHQGRYRGHTMKGHELIFLKYKSIILWKYKIKVLGRLVRPLDEHRLLQRHNNSIEIYIYIYIYIMVRISILNIIIIVIIIILICCCCWWWWWWWRWWWWWWSAHVGGMVKIVDEPFAKRCS